MAKKKKASKVNPIAYVSTKKATAPKTYKQATAYASPYKEGLDTALNTITNWQYDPLQDASYQALASVYDARGNVAAKNTLADAASLNSGYGTSYAVSAAQQARNQYNQELASHIPDLESSAYNKAATRLDALRGADDTGYQRYRDSESDRKWGYEQSYQKYRDLLGDYQWGKNYNLDVTALKKNKTTGGSRSGGRRSSGGGYSGGYTGGLNLADIYKNAQKTPIIKTPDWGKVGNQTVKAFKKKK